MPRRSGSESAATGPAGASAFVTGAARRRRLADARLYLCTDAREREGDLEDFLDAALAGGVDIVQLRQKDLEAAQEIEYLAVFKAACVRHGALLAVNDRADVAYATRPDVLHLGQDDLRVPIAREMLGDEVLIGRSTHDAAQVDAATSEFGVDYFCVGPTWPTPTKPGRAAPGLDLLSHAAQASRRAAGGRPSLRGSAGSWGDAEDRGAGGTDRPWFAIGGIDFATLDEALDRGARRAVVVRAVTGADDPGTAAAELSRRLRARPLDR